MRHRATRLARIAPINKRRKPRRPGSYYTGARSQPAAETVQSQAQEFQSQPLEVTGFTREVEAAESDPPEFQLLINGMPLWGEAVILAVACGLLYWFVSILLPEFPTSTGTGLGLLVAQIVAPVLCIVYLLRRWVSGK